MRWLDSIKELYGLTSIRDIIEEAQERAKWRETTINIGRGHVQLNGI